MANRGQTQTWNDVTMTTSKKHETLIPKGFHGTITKRAQNLKSWASVKRACQFDSGPGHQNLIKSTTSLLPTPYESLGFTRHFMSSIDDLRQTQTRSDDTMTSILDVSRG